MSRSSKPPVFRTDRKDGGRFYYIPDDTGATEAYPSVTTILQAVAKPALVGWAAKEERTLVAEASADLHTEVTGKLSGPLPRAMYLLALQERLGKTKAHQRALAKAADIGKQAHAMIEYTLKAQLGLAVGAEPRLVDEAQWAYMAWQDWARAVQLRPRLIEQTVYSRAHRYAGTMDLLATLSAAALLAVLERQGAVDVALGDWLKTRDRVVALVDFKTGRAIYREAHLQSVAYQRALAEMGHGRVDGGLIVRLPKLTTDPAFEVGVVPPARELFPVFLAVRQLWDWLEVGEAAYRARTQQDAAGAPVAVEVAS